jgi:transposase
MTIDLEHEAEIRRLHYAEHWPVGTVASQLSVHPDAVKRVLGLLEPRKPGPPRARLVDRFRPFVEQTLATYPRLRSTRLHDMLVARGFKGSVRTLRNFVADVRPRPAREAYLRMDPLIGEQAQVDWAHVADVDVRGGRRKLWLFVMVLSWSRALWGEFVFDLTTYSLLRSLLRGAIHFGGNCRQWLFDNPKTVVLGRVGDAVRFHPLLLDFAGKMYVQPRVCAVRKANQKGRVERAIRFSRDRFLAGREITSIEQGNREFADFMSGIALDRPHPTIPNRTVRDCFEEERHRLLALPQTFPETDLVTPARVDKTAFVRFDVNSYSVPPRYVLETLTIAADDRCLRVLDVTGATIARHARSWGRRQTIELPEHREAILVQKRGAREHRGRDRLRAAVPEIDRLFDRWLEMGCNVGSMTSRTLVLLDLYGRDLFAAAVADVLTRGTWDIGAISQLCEQQRVAATRPVPVPVELGAHVPERDVIPHALEGYDAIRRR